MMTLSLNFQKDKFELLPVRLQERVNECFDYKESGFVVKSTDIELNRIADLLRDIALSFESIDLLLAHQCMMLAKKYRKSGPIINQKIDEYEKFLEILNSGNTIIQGLRFSFGHQEPPFPLLKALTTGSYEKDEVRLLKDYVQPEDVVLELGAGIGFMGCVAQTFIKCKQYVSFEANPNLIEIIRNNMQRNNVVFDIRNAVLMDESSEVDFYITPAFWASSLIQPVSGDYKKVTVPALDKNKTINEIKPTTLIVDIEGGEADFFDGLDLTSVNKIILEVHPLILDDMALSNLYLNLFSIGFQLDFKASTKVVNYWHR